MLGTGRERSYRQSFDEHTHVFDERALIHRRGNCEICEIYRRLSGEIWQ